MTSAALAALVLAPSEPTPEPLWPMMTPPASLTTVMSLSAVSPASTPCWAPSMRPKLSTVSWLWPLISTPRELS